jgi:perosamine synthetase
MISQIEPWIDREELKEISRVISSSWITEGPRTKEFEERFAGLAGTRYAITVNNATIGLYICMKVLGIGPRDEVIVPDLTFIATVNSVLMAGARPVLADIDKNTFNISLKSIKSKINKRTRAIIPVHLYGQAADMEGLRELAGKNNLYVIEDAAQGVGVKFNGRHVKPLLREKAESLLPTATG